MYRHAVADRAEPFHRLVGHELGASDAEVGAPDVVALAFDAELVLPGDPSRFAHR